MSRTNLQSLGWQFVSRDKNRNIYHLGVRYSFEHDDEIGLFTGGEFLYKNLSLSELTCLTELVKKESFIICHPDKYTLKEYNNIKKRIDKFYDT